MQKIRSFLWSEVFIECMLLSLISGLVYLLFVPKFGYFNDDWYLMFAAGANGPSVFWDIFAIDRPLRALVMIPAYSLFGANPLYYNLSTFLFRLIGGFCFLWAVRMLWGGNRRVTLWMALLFLVYPGFLSQPNAIDYLCHIAGLAAGMFSIALTIKAFQSTAWWYRLFFYLISIITGWFYLGQIEWYIGLEFFRMAAVFLLSFRVDGTFRTKIIRLLGNAIPSALIPGAFLIWRLFIFKSERGATDVDLQLSTIRTEPLAFLFKFLSALLNDMLDVLLRAWESPLRRLGRQMNNQEWLIGFGVSILVMLLLFGIHKAASEIKTKGTGSALHWRWEAIWIGFGMLVFGLLPVLLVGRSVDFKSFSRYTLISSVGAALLWPVLLSYIPNIRLRNVFFGLLVVLASLTHYANGLVSAKETEATRNFWQQVSWRIPQMEKGTTLIAHYSVVAEEDYFTWGPANLIYYPESNHQEYVQPTIYSFVLNQDTAEKVVAQESKDFSNRRSIRTYPNYRNILILTQPTRDSCVQVIDLNQIELSSAEDPRIAVIAPYSETEHILLNENFHKPPAIPFGSETLHTWCYFYEKAAYARQMGDWGAVARLGDDARSLGFVAKDQIEWMPFLQAYVYLGNSSRILEISSFIKSDPIAAKQACQILTKMSLNSSTTDQINQLFCSK